MPNEHVLDHFRNPRNAGELAPPALTVEATNPACGDLLRLSVLAENGTIAGARFKARGCVAAIACGSVLTELLEGKSLGEARGISAEDIHAALGGLPAESQHACALAIDALALALRAAAG